MKTIINGIKLLLEGQIYILSIIENIMEKQTGSNYSWYTQNEWERKVQNYVNTLNKED